MIDRIESLAICVVCLLVFSCLSPQSLAEEKPAKVFQAGVFAVDITPTQFPVISNGSFTERIEQRAIDRLMSRAWVLDDGETRLAIAVVDSLMIKRELLDEVKRMVTEATGIAEDRILISATHTHTAPSVVACLGSRADANYTQFLPAQIAKSIVLANKNLMPAKIGWAVVQDTDHNACRRWIFRSDHIQTDPFGERNVRAHMHPGYLSPKHVGPAGPADPDLSLIAIKTVDGKILSVLGNYAMHYFGSTAISADTCGRFGDKFAALLKAEEIHPGFVGILSQGTSGDGHWMDYSKPKRNITLDTYAEELARAAFTGFQTIEYHDWVPLAMAEQTLKLRRRTPDEDRLAWARAKMEALGEKELKSQSDIYAHEQICLHDEPEVELKLQAIRIGDLGITAIPNEVYAITGFKLKAQSPFETTFNIELANGALGYIPPPEQHHLGGYTTWPARTAGLEVQAEPQIVETLLSLLEQVAGSPRRKVEFARSPYAEAILESKPIAYWVFEELADSIAIDQQQNQHGTYEPGVVRYLPGPQRSGMSAGLRGNRAAHFAGGRMKSAAQDLGDTYSVECWIWNGFPHDVRPVTGYFFSRGKDDDTTAAGDHLGIGGTSVGEGQGKLIFFNGNESNQLLIGKTDLTLKSWNHVVFVREGRRVTVYLNGEQTPEISGEAEVTFPTGVSEIFVGGRNDRFALFEGKIDEVSLYDRALSPREIADHYQRAGVNVSDTAPAKGTTQEETKPQGESPPLEPRESLSTIVVPDGYAIELVACEPLVKDPVAIAWDAAGRLWVVEMADYPLGIDGNGKPGGRIRVLEDTNDDGRYDQAFVFAAGLSYPTGVLPWNEGAIITAAPNILYYADTEGDKKADQVETLFSGFHEGNQQLRMNGLRRGLDNWVYCASGSHVSNYGADSRIRSVATGEQIPLGSRDFRFRPETGELDPQAGPTQYGRNRDDWGNWFGSMNSHPLWHYVLADHYTRRNAFAAPPDARKQLILPRNPRVFPAKAPQKRFHNFQQSGRFTSACSAMIYRDRLLFPESGDRHGFTCEPFHNLVQHYVVKDDGVTFTAERSPKNAKVDFFASKDRWCRPVMARTGPDGALWIVDMYRYMIEHPQWLTPEGREELKPFYRHGEERGRIYRIVRKGQKLRDIPNLIRLSSEQLVQLLSTPNGTQRDLIQETLIHRADASVGPALANLLKNSTAPLARLHALCTLDGLGLATPEVLLAALKDTHPGIQKHAVRIAEPVAANHPRVLDAVVQLVQSPNAKVRLQLACSLGAWPNEKSGTALAQLMVQDPSDAYLVAAAMSSVSDRNIEIVLRTVLSENPNSTSSSVVNRLVEQAVAMGHTTVVTDSLRFAIAPENARSTVSKFNFLASMLGALRKNRIVPKDFLHKTDPAGTVSAQIAILTNLARTAVIDSDAGEPLRIAAIPVLAQFPEQRLEDFRLLADTLTPLSSPAIQSATIRLMASFSEVEVAGLLLRNWKSHSPSIRTQILSSLLSRPDWVFTLLEQIEGGMIAVSEIDAVTRQKLALAKNADIQARVKAILQTAGGSDRREVIHQYRDALTLSGEPSQGKAIFKKTCAACHKLENVGFDIGPNLASLTDRRAETLLTAILNPTAAVDSKYMTYTVLTDDGRVFNGILGAESGNSITLVMQENRQEVILRNQIEEIQSTGKSMMPDGLEKDTSVQDIANLLSYLRSDQHHGNDAKVRE